MSQVFEMDAKEDGEGHEEGGSSSPIAVLQEMSEEALRVAGEPLNSPNMPPLAPGHRRAQSEVLTTRHKRSNSFQKLKNQMQKAWRWGTNQDDSRMNFNPEVLLNQKRQWYRLHSKSKGHVNYQEPTSLFEHFIIAGLHPDTNLQIAEAAFIKRKKWETDMISYGITDLKLLQQKGPPIPTLEPQVLFKYPPGKRLAMRLKDLASFCFPGGVKARLMEKTPSLSDLNQIVYGQEHLGKDDLAFIFSLKVADNATLYGVCLHVSEIVQRPPAILGITSPLPHSSGGLFRFLVSAPRCYCVLSKYPFFELHYEMLNSIIQQERLNRITQFVTGMSLIESVSSFPKIDDESNHNDDSPETEPCDYWMNSAIPIHSAVALTAVAAGIIPDDETPTSSLKIWEPQSPESATASDVPDFIQILQIEYLEVIQMAILHGEVLGVLNLYLGGMVILLQKLGHLFCPGTTHWSVLVVLNLYSARSMSEDDDDDLSSTCEKEFSDDLIMAWARENKNDLLQIVCGFHSLPLPERGSDLAFQPLEHLQAIQYKRPSIAALGFDEKSLESSEDPGVDAKLAAAEEALSLSLWTTATICRVLSVESILALLAGVLLEKQVIVVCPNLGVLSATVLSLIPMIRPFQWQSLMLPVLPGKMLDFLDAPVPFIIGIEQVPADLKKKTSDPVVINVVKDQVKLSHHLPALPRYKELALELVPFHSKLSMEGSFARKHPVYRCTEVQAEAAVQFLKVIRNYIESLCSELSFYTITSVQSNNDRVSILLKDSFIDSFPSKDRSFMKLLVDTQMFSVLSDSRLSSLENGNP
ncbi:uncharacterized protein LOC126784096 [Argentina anserina]|uniref:uncharacterized protein LOC126784096 n=1 Tax=Argentina anserina TaxID=57926 RepID=UPI00217671F1|nr:uncharacterized protein LOC126784096 [Potentilla anserina]